MNNDTPQEAELEPSHFLIQDISMQTTISKFADDTNIGSIAKRQLIKLQHFLARLEKWLMKDDVLMKINVS